MLKRSLTQIFILATVIIWIVYDLIVFERWGNAATISANLWRYSVQAPGIAFAFGLLCGHLFYQMQAPTAFPDEKK